MTLYYVMPLLTSMLLGTLLTAFLTKALGNPNGTVLNAILLITSSIATVFVFTALIPESIFTIFIIYIIQLIIIMNLYKVDLFNGLFFVFVNFAFGTTISEILAKPVANLILSIL